MEVRIAPPHFVFSRFDHLGLLFASLLEELDPGEDICAKGDIECESDSYFEALNKSYCMKSIQMLEGS